MFKREILILFLALYIRNSSCFMNDIWKAVEEVWKFTTIVEEIDAANNTKMGFYESIRGENSNQKIAQHFQRMQDALHRIEHDQQFEFNALANSLIGVPYDFLRMEAQRDIAWFITEVDEDYEKFSKYITEGKTTDQVLNVFTLIYLRNKSEWNKTREILIPSRNRKFLNIGPVIPIADRQFKIIDDQCDSGQTLQNLLVTLFRMIMTAEVKSYIMLVFSYRYRYIKNDEWKSRMHDVRTDIKEQFVKYLQAFSNSMEVIDSAYLRACDPKNNSWIQNESFYEVNGFFETVIFKYPKSNCRYTSCHAMWHKYRDECGAQWFDTRTQCSGRVLGCAWLGNTTACALKEGPHKYQWISSSRRAVVGRDYYNCPEKSSYIIATTDPTDSVEWSSCICDCAKEYGTIYLGRLTSAKNRNYVITGLRFQLTANNMLFLQPAEGKLEANGHVSNSSWVPLPDVIGVRDVGTIDPSWRSFFFDDLRLPAGYALTGIEFVTTTRGRDTPINGYSIKISGVPFNYETGELNVLPTFEKTEMCRKLDIMEALPFKQVNPIFTSSNSSNRPSPQKYTYVKLRQTGIAEEFAQSMLPLFDSVPILTTPSSPLGGIGIFHKGSKDHAGFISLRLYSINYRFYVEEFMRTYEKNATKMWNV